MARRRPRVAGTTRLRPHRVDQVGEGAAQRRVTGLGERPAGDERAVAGGAVVGQEVDADRAGEALDHAADVALGPAQAVAHPVDHDPQHAAGAGLAELDQSAREPGEPDRVGAADHQHLVGGLERLERHPVAAGAGPAVVGLAVLEREPGVDHDVGARCGPLEDLAGDAVAHLHPAVGAGQPGQHLEPVADQAPGGREPAPVELARR